MKQFDFNKVVVFDIEIGVNYFLVCFKSVNKETKKSFIVCEWQNDSQQLYEFIQMLREHDYWFVGFNNLEFDSQLLETFLDNYDTLWSDIVYLIYNQAQELISEKTDFNKWDYIIPEWKLRTNQLDVFKQAHFDNPAKRSSLKSLQINLEWYNILDSPYKHYEQLTFNQIKEVEDYCWNDVDSTEAFYKTRIENIQLRNDLSKKYKINLLNKPDASVGTDIIKIEYCKLSGRNFNEFKRERDTDINFTFDKIISDKVKFDTSELQKVLEDIKKYSPDTLKDYKFIFRGTKYTVALGGLHSDNKHQIWEENDEYCLVDFDFGSYYPNIIISLNLYPPHLGQEFTQLVKDITDRRLKAKAEGDKKTAEQLKISANSIYGKLGDKQSWLQSMRTLYTVTMNGQLFLLMLVEQLVDFQVFMANTDGITVKVKRDELQEFYNICNKFSEYLKIPVEYAHYKKCIFTSVNDYLIQKIDGELKKKGDWITKFDWHQNNSYRIIPIALEKFFINDIPVEKTIKSHQNILDFCAKKKSVGEWWYESREVVNGQVVITKLQKNNRYYISNKGGVLYKLHKDGREQFVDAHPLQGRAWYTIVLNKLDNKPIEDRDIHYEYYIRECQKKIHALLPNQLKLF
jgi:DNA polymerase elongation subunit (family B)